MDFMSSFKVSFVLFLLYGFLLAKMALGAPTLCEIKSLATDEVLSTYEAEECDIRKFGGLWGRSTEVVHTKNDAEYTKRVQERVAAEAAEDQRKLRLQQVRTALRGVDLDSEVRAADVVPLLKNILRLLKEKGDL